RAVWRILAGGLFLGQRRVGVHIPMHPISKLRLEEECFSRGYLIADLTERRNVIEYPERPAVSPDHYVIVFDHQIANRARGHIQSQRLPVVPVVKRNVNGPLAPAKQQAAPNRVLSNDVYRSAVAKAVDDFLPRLAAVVRAI